MRFTIFIDLTFSVLGLRTDLLLVRVFLTTVAIERFFFILVKLIFEIFCFFFYMMTFVDLIVLVLYFTYF